MTMTRCLSSHYAAAHAAVLQDTDVFHGVSSARGCVMTRCVTCLWWVVPGVFAMLNSLYVRGRMWRPEGPSGVGHAACTIVLGKPVGYILQGFQGNGTSADHALSP